LWVRFDPNTNFPNRLQRLFVGTPSRKMLNPIALSKHLNETYEPTIAHRIQTIERYLDRIVRCVIWLAHRPASRRVFLSHDHFRRLALEGSVHLAVRRLSLAHHQTP
jgi:hypothetical protein